MEACPRRLIIEYHGTAINQIQGRHREAYPRSDTVGGRTVAGKKPYTFIGLSIILLNIHLFFVSFLFKLILDLYLDRDGKKGRGHLGSSRPLQVTKKTCIYAFFLIMGPWVPCGDPSCPEKTKTWLRESG